MATKETAQPGNQVAVLQDKLTQLDTFAEQNNLLVLTEGKGGFSAAIAMADAMAQLKAMLTEDVMKPIMALQGSALGFKTDKDKEGGYELAVVRDFLIEATIKRFNVYGNQANIIAGRFYATKEGFEDFFLRQGKAGKVTDLRDSYSPVKIVSDGEAMVTASATWKKDGIADKLENVPLQIRMNKGMGADGARGKAKRKLLAMIYSRVTGTIITEGDANEAPTIDVASTKVGEPGSSAPGSTPDPKAATDEQKQLLNELLTEANSIDKANAWLIANKLIPTGGTYKDVSTKFAARIIGDPKKFIATINEANPA